MTLSSRFTFLPVGQRRFVDEEANLHRCLHQLSTGSDRITRIGDPSFFIVIPTRPDNRCRCSVAVADGNGTQPDAAVAVRKGDARDGGRTRPRVDHREGAIFRQDGTNLIVQLLQGITDAIVGNDAKVRDATGFTCCCVCHCPPPCEQHLTQSHVVVCMLV